MGTTRSSYYGNCEDHAVIISVLFIYTTGVSGGQIDEGTRCVPAQTDYLLGTVSTSDYLWSGYGAYATGTC